MGGPAAPRRHQSRKQHDPRRVTSQSVQRSNLRVPSRTTPAACPRGNRRRAWLAARAACRRPRARRLRAAACTASAPPVLPRRGDATRAPGPDEGSRPREASCHPVPAHPPRAGWPTRRAKSAGGVPPGARARVHPPDSTPTCSRYEYPWLRGMPVSGDGATPGRFGGPKSAAYGSRELSVYGRQQEVAAGRPGDRERKGLAPLRVHPRLTDPSKRQTSRPPCLSRLRDRARLLDLSRPENSRTSACIEFGSGCLVPAVEFLRYALFVPARRNPRIVRFKLENATGLSVYHRFTSA